MSRRVRTAAAAAVVALVGALLTAAPSQATSALLGPILGPLPAWGTSGGTGTPALNDAVSRSCYASAPLGDPQWFTLPAGNLGPVYARGHSLSDNNGHRPDELATRAALVDVATGSVLSCNGGPVPTSGHTTAVVVWVSPSEYSHYLTSCGGPDYWCEDPTTTVYVAPTTGAVPDNDALANARAVPSLPFTDGGDSSLATKDGPDFPATYPGGSSIDPTDYGTVWWTYTATRTGLLPAAATSDVFRARTVLAEQTPSGLVPIPYATGDLGDPLYAFPVETGKSYVIGVDTTVDRYYEPPPLDSGGAYTMTLGRIGAPLWPELTTAVTSGTDAVDVSWAGDGTTPGMAPTTSFAASIVSSAPASTPTTVTLPASARSHTFTGLDPAASYAVSVHATNALGDGMDATRRVTFATGATSPPTGPVRALDAVTVSATRTSTLRWQQPASATLPITGYRVTRSGTDSAGRGPVVVDVPRGARSFAFSHLRPGATYQLTVRPLTSSGSGPVSGVRTSVLRSPVAPAHATTVRAVGDNAAHSITLRWQPPVSDGQTPVTGYRITRNGTDDKGSGAFTTLLSASARSFTLSHLNGHWDYSMTVRAVNAVGAGPAVTLVGSLWTDTAGPPTRLVVGRGSRSATVRWTPPTSAGASALTGYRVRLFAGSSLTVLSTSTVSASSASFTARGLVNGARYSFDVTSITRIGAGGVSLRSAVAAPATAPGRPVIGVAVSGAPGGAVTAVARWSPPLWNGGSRITGYVVTAWRMGRKGVVLGISTSVRPPTSRYFTLRLPSVGLYRFSVRAINSVGRGTTSGRSNLVVGR